MLLQIRSFWHEGLLSSADPDFLDYYDDHQGNYSRYWRQLLRWLSFQDTGIMIDRFDHAMMLRGGAMDDQQCEDQHVSEEEDHHEEEVRSRHSRQKKDKKAKKDHKKSKESRRSPSKDPEENDEEGEDATGHLEA
eukprot:5860976-Amphidinium_carterae.1